MQGKSLRFDELAIVVTLSRRSPFALRQIAPRPAVAEGKPRRHRIKKSNSLSLCVFVVDNLFSAGEGTAVIAKRIGRVGLPFVPVAGSLAKANGE